MSHGEIVRPIDDGMVSDTGGTHESTIGTSALSSVPASSKLLALPEDLLQQVYDALPLQESERSSQACKIFRKLASHHVGWQVIDSGLFTKDAASQYLFRSKQATQKPHSLKLAVGHREFTQFNAFIDSLDVSELSKLELYVCYESVLNIVPRTEPIVGNVGQGVALKTKDLSPIPEAKLAPIIRKLPALEELRVEEENQGDEESPYAMIQIDPYACVLRKLRKVGLRLEPCDVDFLLQSLPLEELEVMNPGPNVMQWWGYQLCSPTLEVVDFRAAGHGSWITSIDCPKLRHVMGIGGLRCAGFIVLNQEGSALPFDVRGSFTAAQGFSFAFITPNCMAKAITFGPGNQPPPQCQFTLEDPVQDKERETECSTM